MNEFEGKRTREMRDTSLRSELCTNGVFCAISDLREFWYISGCSSSCSSSQIVTLFIRNKFGDLSLIKIQKSHVMALFLIFEARLTHIVPMHSTRLSRVVQALNMFI